ncbi:MAG: Asp23/Gls24 family envelope stress response protein [bacterium]
MSDGPSTRLSDPSVADEVFATIAALCACRVPGVAGLGGISVERAEEILRNSDMVRGVNVTCTGEGVAVDISVDMSDRIPIPQIASALQSEVKQWIEEMTGHMVTAVNIAVESIKIYDLQEETVGSPVDDSQTVGV